MSIDYRRGYRDGFEDGQRHAQQQPAVRQPDRQQPRPAQNKRGKAKKYRAPRGLSRTNRIVLQHIAYYDPKTNLDMNVLLAEGHMTVWQPRVYDLRKMGYLEPGDHRGPPYKVTAAGWDALDKADEEDR